MILKSLYLKNYRTYKGPEEIVFSSGGSNVTIIQGNNEVGKTTLMNAITWCLYGQEYYKLKGNNPIWSKITCRDMEIGDEDTVEVRITMEQVDGTEVQFVRYLEFYKNDTGKCVEGGKDWEIYEDDSPVENKNTYLSKNFPENIREYFLFDGEQLGEYFKNSDKDIGKEVRKLSHLDLLKNIENHISLREDDLNDDLDELNPSESKVRKDIKKLKNSLESNKAELKKIDSNLKTWKEEVSAWENEIKKYGEKPEELINTKQTLTDDLEKLEDRIEKEKIKFSKFLGNNFPKILSINSLINVRLLCDDLEDGGFIPSPYNARFFQHILDTHKCVCGADLSDETSEEYLKIKKLCDEAREVTELEDESKKLIGRVDSIINDFPTTFEEDLIDFMGNIDDLKTKESNISKKIKNIEELLDDDAEKKVRKLRKEIKSKSNVIDYNIERKGSIKKDIEKIEIELKEKNAELQEEIAKSSRKTELSVAIDFCQTVHNEVRRIYKELDQDIHNQLEKLTSEEFSKMHWKEKYRGVSIDDKYNVIISEENESGDIEEIIPNDLSAGGQLVLALSFTTALNSLSGFDLPIIIDTPLSRLDEPMKENIAEYLPIYTKDKQVTFLVTGSEYSEGFRKLISNVVDKDYVLNHDEKSSVTTIDRR